MITTLHVSMAVTGIAHPEIKVWDPRVLLAAQQVLARRPGVTQAPDLLPWAQDQRASTLPIFAVALNDTPDGSFGERMAVTTLLEHLTEETKIHIAFAQDGGWKVAILTLDFSVARL